MFSGHVYLKNSQVSFYSQEFAPDHHLDVPNMLKLHMPQTGLISLLSFSVSPNPWIGTTVHTVSHLESWESFFTSILPFPCPISYQVLRIPKDVSFSPFISSPTNSVLFQTLITPHLDNSKGLLKLLASSLSALYLAFTMQSEGYKDFPQNE